MRSDADGVATHKALGILKKQMKKDYQVVLFILEDWWYQSEQGHLQVIYLS